MMLIRSSSTPLLGSLLPSFSESPNHHHHHHHPQPEPHTTTKRPPTTTHNHKKLTIHETAASPNFTKYSCNSSPISPSIAEFFDAGRHSHNSNIRRAQSEGNLEGLANANGSCNNIDEFSISNPLKKFPRRHHCSMLETIPSFSFHNSSRYEEEDSDYEEEEDREVSEKNDGLFKNSFRGGMEGDGLNSEEKNVGLNKEMRYLNDCKIVGFEDSREEVSAEMYLARGLGLNGVSIGFLGGGGGGGDFIPVAFGRSGGRGSGDGIEEHYKTMVEENPGNPLFLRNYAQFLYQYKHDSEKAEEYYSRAILADPKDGEILAQYAKIVWELHRDRDRATTYFERAVQASPQDSHVQAAHASFLWETEEDELDHDDSKAIDANVVAPVLLHEGAMPPATV